MQQVAVGGVQLDAVQAGGDRALGGVDELRDDAGQLVGRERARLDEVLHALGREDLTGGADRGRRDRLQAGDRRVADAAGVHELGDDPPAARVHGVGDQAPAGDLRVGVQARGARVALADRRGLGALGDDQAGAGALGVVLGVERGRRAALAGAVARHRRHHEAVGELELTQPVGREQVRGHGSSVVDRDVDARQAARGQGRSPERPGCAGGHPTRATASAQRSRPYSRRYSLSMPARSAGCRAAAAAPPGRCPRPSPAPTTPCPARPARRTGVSTLLSSSARSSCGGVSVGELRLRPVGDVDGLLHERAELLRRRRRPRARRSPRRRTCRSRAPARRTPASGRPPPAPARSVPAAAAGGQGEHERGQRDGSRRAGERVTPPIVPSGRAGGPAPSTRRLPRRRR